MRAPLAGLALLLGCQPAQAAPAGTVVSNTASASFDLDGRRTVVASNTVSFTIAERLDVAVIADAPTLIAGPAGTIGFRVTNLGNGDERFALVAAASGAIAVTGLALDVDGDGRFDAAIDRPLSDGALALGAGESAHVFAVAGGASAPGDVVSLTATAASGSGAPGSLLAGRGVGGGDAVVGTSGASATARSTFVAGAAAPATLIKSQAVAAPDGSPRAVRGAVVIYTLEARFAAPVAGVTIEDPVPAGTIYVPGSLTLDGVPQTDADRDDAGAFTAGTISVALGDIPAPGNRTIRFKVTLQ